MQDTLVCKVFVEWQQLLERTIEHCLTNITLCTV